MSSFSTRLLALAVCSALIAGGAAPRKPASRATPKIPEAARAWMRAMTLERKAAQLIFVPFNGAAPNTRSREFREYARLVRDVGVGGLILVNWSDGRVIPKAEPYELATFVNRMQRMAKVPLLVSGDFERGASMRVDGTTAFPHAMAFAAAGDPELTRYQGMETAREARALGVHWVFYPVADVNNNPDNPIINIRSFGEDPETVSAHVRAFIEGVHADPRRRVLATAKHFPGHGDTTVDTHLDMAVVTADRERLEKVEMAPFRAAIEAGVDAVMSAHVAAPALGPAGVPATLAPEVMTDLLRRQMGFQGIVVTDALEMEGIAKGFRAGEAAVRALEAGADVLLMPRSPEEVLKAVVAAVRSGRLSRQRIDASVARILAAKVQMGLHRRRTVNLEAIEDEVNSPEANERAREVAERAVTLVRNRNELVPLRVPASACFFVLAESPNARGGMVFAQEVRRRVPGARLVMLDPTARTAALEEALRQTAECSSVVVAAFASVAAYRGNTSLPGEYPAFLEKLTASGKPVTLVALGNPYLLRSFPTVDAYLATYSTAPVSEAAAVRALFGEIPIRGKLPVTIPGLAALGAGLTVPARTAPQGAPAATMP